MSGRLWWAAIAGLLVALLLTLAGVGMMVAGAWQHAAARERFERACGDAGGHLYRLDVELCLDTSGRVVEVYP